jgi:hypothetical protein
MPASLLLLNPSPPRRRLRKNAWSHRANGFPGHSRRTMAGRVISATRSRGRSGRKSGRKNPTMRLVIETGAPVRVSRSAGRAGVKKMAKKRRSAKQKAWAKKLGKRFGGNRKGKARKNPHRKAHRKAHRKSRKARRNPRPQTLAIRAAKSRAAAAAAAAAVPVKKAGKKKSKARKHSKRSKARKHSKRSKARKHPKRSKARKSHPKRRRSMKRRVKRGAGGQFLARIKSTGRSAKKYSSYSRRRNVKRGMRRRAAERGRVVRSRRSALIVRRSLARGGAGGKYARAHGLTRVNPSMAGLKTDLITLLPCMGVGIASLVGLSWVGATQITMLVSKLPESVKKAIPASVQPFLPAIGTGILSVVAYAMLRMSKNAKLQRCSAWALAGGLGAVTLQVLANVQVDDALPAGQAGPPMKISLGKKLGLPLGEFVGVSGYVTSASGQELAVNGLGEFVGVSGSLMDASGQRIAVNGFGDYIPGEVGMGGGIFERAGTKSSFGRLGAAYDGNPSQDAQGREWSHGLSNETSAEDILDGDDEEGSLAGDIFGDG